jgi:hypothetical protein
VGPTGAAQVGAVQTATQAQVTQAIQGLQMEKSIFGEGDGGKVGQTQTQVAAALANAIVQATSDASAPPPSSFQQPQSSPIPDATQIPPVSTTILQNDLPSGPLLQLDALTMSVPTGTSVMTFGPGSPNTVVPIGVTGKGMQSTVIALPAAGTFEATGNTITHTGPLLGLNSAALVSYDSTTPLMQVGATAFSNSGDVLLTMANGSLLTSFGPLLGLQAGANLSIAGGLAADGMSIVALGPAPAVSLPSGSSLTTTGPLVSLTGGSSAELSGSILRAVDSTVTGTSTGVLAAIDASEIKLTGAPCWTARTAR